MKNLHFHLNAVKTGTHKAKVGAGGGTFFKSETELEQEPEQIVSAPQHLYYLSEKYILPGNSQELFGDRGI